MKFNELPINKEDLEEVSKFLAPYYGISPYGKSMEIENDIRRNVNVETSIETGGFIAVRIGEQIRVFLGNHLIGCEVIKIAAKGKNFKKIKMGGI